MLDAKPALDKWLSPQDYEAIAAVTANAYLACDEFLRSSIVTNEFPPGAELRSYLINPFVQHALMTWADKSGSGFFTELKPNVAHNCSHLRLYKGNFTLTSHFLGRKSERDKARSAKCRAALASRNFDLFPDATEASELPTDHIYCQLLHGGLVRPDVVCLAIPNSLQTGISHSMPLQIPEPKLTEAEQIREELVLQLLDGVKRDHEKAAG